MPLGRFDGKPAPPLDRLLGAGLDARQFTDLAALDSNSLVTPTDRFYIRTAAPLVGSQPGVRALVVDGRVRRRVSLAPEELAGLAREMGTHVIECSGNSDPANFGLISAASWTGVPVAALLDRAEPQPASLVRITGADDESRSWQSSIGGASWIFTRDALERAGAFIATGMNGQRLTRDHGFPVRLVVPNWYGCVAIKWVTGIDLVAEDQPPTSQMREFAIRTHQEGAMAIAREYQPATIDLAAMPVRVEQWVDGSRVAYRVVGIRWGGDKAGSGLMIRFRASETFTPVDDSPPPSSLTTWSLWSHTWRPDVARRYQIALAANDRSIRTRRLDLFYYTREVEIERV
jgi:DMSO/TMAO reductase YedYZ molybdopterin-dependent catalytic subunit